MQGTLTEAWEASNDRANLWTDTVVKFLDPCTKSGLFLWDITRHLIEGLAANKEGK